MPTTKTSKLAKAVQHHQSGRLAQAEQSYRNILKARPDTPDALNLLGVLCSQTGRHDEALRHLDRAGSIAPDAAAVHYNRGNVLRQLQRFDDALESYRHTVSLLPEHASAHFNLALTLIELGRSDDALDALADATKADPDHARAHDQRARILLERGDPAAAARHWQAALAADPEAADVRLNLGQSLYHLGRLDESIACFAKVTQLTPREPAGWCNLGAALRMAGRTSAAIDALREAIRLEPTLFEAHLNLIRSLMDAEDLPEAMKTCEAAAELEPNASLPRREMARIFLRAGELDAAEEHLRAALELEPQSIDALSELGDLLRKRGAYAHAAATYQQASRIAPDSDDVRAHQVEMHLERGQLSEALELADAALRQRAPEVTLVSAAARVLIAGGEAGDAARLLESALHRNDLSPGQRAALLFHLGDARDRLGDHDRAWKACEEANQLKRARYDRAAAQRQAHAIIDFFDAARLDSLPRATGGCVKPIFLAGMPRSGKTLVEQILDCHPDVRGGGEMSLIQRTSVRLQALLHSDEPFPHCLSGLQPSHVDQLAAFANVELEKIAGGSDHVVETTPNNFLFVGLISILLPSARIVFCMRDAADTCVSCYFRNFSGSHPYAYDQEDLAVQHHLHQRVMDHWLVLRPLPICSLPYEALVEDQQRMTRQLLDFCDLPWSDRCLRPHENPRPVSTASAMDVRQPVFRSSIGRHRAYAKHLGPLLAALAAEDDDAPA